MKNSNLIALQKAQSLFIQYFEQNLINHDEENRKQIDEFKQYVANLDYDAILKMCIENSYISRTAPRCLSTDDPQYDSILDTMYHTEYNEAILVFIAYHFTYEQFLDLCKAATKYFTYNEHHDYDDYLNEYAMLHDVLLHKINIEVFESDLQIQFDCLLSNSQVALNEQQLAEVIKTAKVREVVTYEVA